MKALVFAAGLGTRLRPLTDSLPKALVPVGGVPMLSRVLDKLYAAGIEDITVNAFAHADKVAAFLRENYPDVNLSREFGEALETGGGVRHAERFLKGGSFLLHNADILSDLDFGWLLDSYDRSALATLVVREAESDRYLLFDEEMKLAGWMNSVTGEVRSPYSDLKPETCRRYAFCGIHVLSDKVFGLMEGWPERFGIVDFYLSVCADRKIRGLLAENINLVDIGSPETLAQANSLFDNI